MSNQPRNRIPTVALLCNLVPDNGAFYNSHLNYSFPRTPKLAKRKSTTTTIENAEPLPTKQARVKSDPIYDDELVDQDIFDGYMDNGEDDRVTEGDVQDKLGNEVRRFNPRVRVCMN